VPSDHGRFRESRPGGGVSVVSGGLCRCWQRAVGSCPRAINQSEEIVFTSYGRSGLRRASVLDLVAVMVAKSRLYAQMILHFSANESWVLLLVRKCKCGTPIGSTYVRYRISEIRCKSAGKVRDSCGSHFCLRPTVPPTPRSRVGKESAQAGSAGSPVWPPVPLA
jgi:hypothetical protein